MCLPAYAPQEDRQWPTCKDSNPKVTNYGWLLVTLIKMESASNLWPQWNNGEGYKINEFLDISYKFRISAGLEADF